MTTATSIDNLSLSLTEEIRVRASLDATFDSLLAQIGRLNQTPDGNPLPMVIETWPGGRWYRELGGDNGHLWGHVQSIKRPGLLEIFGPLFMSFPVMSNLQWRLTAVNDGTLIVFRHTALGFIPDEVRKGMTSGWHELHERVLRAAEAEEN
jgi:hypothetical protein